MGFYACHFFRFDKPEQFAPRTAVVGISFWVFEQVVRDLVEGSVYRPSAPTEPGFYFFREPNRFQPAQRHNIL